MVHLFTAVHVCRRFDQLVPEALMVPFAMVVDHKFADRVPEVPLTEWNEAIQTFFLNRAQTAPDRRSPWARETVS